MRGWEQLRWQNYLSISFQTEWDMIVVTVFLSIFWTKWNSICVQNWKENCHHNHIPFDLKGNGNIVFSVYHPHVYSCPRDVPCLGHYRGPIEGPSWTPWISHHYAIEGWNMGIILSHIILRNASLSDSRSDFFPVWLLDVNYSRWFSKSFGYPSWYIW